MLKAVIDTNETIWGIGNSKENALSDAFKNMNEETYRLNQSEEWETYDDFKNSTTFEQLKVIDITESGAKTVKNETGGLKDMWYGKLTYQNGCLKTTDEE